MRPTDTLSSSAFTDHLQKTQRAEMHLLQNFRYRFPEHPAEEPLERLVRSPFKEKTFVERAEERERKGQCNLRIDSGAFVVGGKLVYLKEEEADVREDKRRLMQLLKENRISYKKYVMGDKQQYLHTLAAHQKDKEERVVNDYIKKYINMEKNTRIETANNFENTKQQLFLTK
jgi:hypothetical protein